MRQGKLTDGQALDYRQTPVSQSTVRRSYAIWRTQQGLAICCDIPSCQLHAPGQSWNGKPVAMIFDHIDGSRYNSRPSNLRLVCPNCNSQLPTHGGGNKGRIQNPTSDSYQIVDRKSGRRDVVVMLTGIVATGVAGSLGVAREKP